MANAEFITSKHGIIIPIVKDVSEEDILDGIIDHVGSANIYSFGKYTGYYKVFLKTMELVEEVVKSGIKVRGLHYDVEYNNPTGTKVILKNIPSDISDNMVKEKLASIGHVVSSIKPLVFNHPNPKYAGILTHNRLAFIKTEDKKNIPPNFDMEFNGEKFTFTIEISTIEEALKSLEKSGDFPLKKRIGRPRKIKTELKESNNKTVVIKRRYKRRMIARKTKFFKNRSCKFLKEKNLDSSEKSFISLNIESDIDEDIPEEDINNCDVHMPHVITISAAKDMPCLPSSSSTVYEDISLLDKEECQDKLEEPKNIYTFLEFPFSLEKLNCFLNVAKSNRNPFEVASSMLQENETPAAVPELCEQLKNYMNYTDDRSLKIRIQRLINLFSGGKLNA